MRNARTARHARPGARSERVLWHVSRQLTGGQTAQGHGPALQGVTWNDVVRSAMHGRTTWRSTQRTARGDNARRGATGGGRRRDAQREVFTRRFHGHRHTRLTWSKAPAHSEEGGRWRCGSHQRGQRHRSSTAVKVSVLWVGEQLQALRKLLDL
jgi:hypothetical protein